jgi:hypothetical protein
MFDVETTKTLRKTRKKNLGSFLAMLFCTLVILSTMGNSFGIRNSYAQQQQQQLQLQTQQPAILTHHSPLSNNLSNSYAQQQQPQTQQPPILTYHPPLSSNLRNSSAQQQLQNQQPSTVANSSAQQQLQNQQPSTVALSPWSNNLQAICGHGVCSGTANSGNTQNNHSGNTQWHNNNIMNPFLMISSSPSKSLDLEHTFTSTKVVGPDRFRFINSYWTTPDTSNGVDVGTSSAFLTANPLPPNPKLEVDTNEGYSTLAVALQYQGVVQLSGIAAGLKLPIGFKAINPLTSDRNNFDIVLSSYRGNIVPGQGVVLYFPMYILPTAKVGLPVLGQLALHFLRTNDRLSSDVISPSESNTFSKTLMFTSTRFPNSTTIMDTFTPTKDWNNFFTRDIPFDFINQVIPVTWHVTGQETIDVVTLPTLGKDAVKTISTNFVTIPNGKTTLVRLAVRNTGDAPVWDLTVNVLSGLQSNLGINGLTPSAITSPNIPQTLFSTILPIGIAGPAFFGIGELGPNQNAEFDVRVFPTHYVAGTVELLNVRLVYNNIVGERVDTSVPSNAINPTPSVCCQVYFNVAPNP